MCLLNLAEVFSIFLRGFYNGDFMNSCLIFKMGSLVLLLVCAFGASGIQPGPDPWEWNPRSSHHEGPTTIPPDIRLSLSSTKVTDNDAVPYGDYFFRRLLTIVLKHGSVKTEADGSKEIFIAMKLSPKKWILLEEIIKLESKISDEMYRRSIGYVSESVYRPSLKEKVVQAWSEYTVAYFRHYQDEITWLTTIAAIGLSVIFLKKYMSMSKLLWIVLFISLYFYEGLLAYKEYERQDYNKFVDALSSCKWRFWSSSCNMPVSDPLVFWKHMHPAKIFLRMIGHFVTEPMLIMSSSVNEISNQITKNLWPPFNTIINGMLIVVFTIMCIIVIFMLIFTCIFNMSFNVGFLMGLVSFGVSKESRTSNNTTQPLPISSDSSLDRISGENLQKLMNMISNHQMPLSRHQNLCAVDGKSNGRESRSTHRTPLLLYRSHSTGRLSGDSIAR